MAFSLTLKRTFEEVLDVSCTTDPTAAFRIPVKRQRLQVTPRKLGLEYHELISVEGSPDCDGVRQGEDPDVPRLRVVTSSPPGLMTSPSPRTYRRDVFAKEELPANATVGQTSFERQFSGARSQACTDLTRLALLAQPVAGSACLNSLNIPEYQAQLSTSPLRANEVPEKLDDRATGFSGGTLLPQLFQHPSMRHFSLLKPGSSLCLWQTDDGSTASRNGFPDAQRILDGSSMRRIGGNGSLGPRSRVSDRGGSEAELASIGDEETTVGPVEVCAECQKVFKRKVYLQRHMEREHWLPAKVFKCDDCKYETKHQSNLSVHRRTHTGERPYHCGACGQRYTQGHLLKSHIRSRHAGNLRFYNLDKRSDSTRGRKSLDFKHDIYLSLQPNKGEVVVPSLGSILAGPDANSIQAFTYQRERLSSSYNMPRLQNPPPPLTSWDIPGRSKMQRGEWSNSGGGGGSYFALIPQRSTNDPPSFLSTVSAFPFFSQRSLNLSSTELPVFQTDLTQLLSADRKPAYQSNEYDDHLSTAVRLLSGSMSGVDGQPRFANDSRVNFKDGDFGLYCERSSSPPQSFPEDLTVTKRPDVFHEDPSMPTTSSPFANGGSSPDNSIAVDADDDRSSPAHRQSLPTTKHIDEVNSKTNTITSRPEPKEEMEGYHASVKKRHHHLLDDDISTVQGLEWSKVCDEEKADHVMRRKQPEVTLKDDHDEAPTDLSIARQSPSRKNSTDCSVGPTDEASSFPYPDSDDNSNSVSASSSSDTSLPLKHRPRHILPGEQREEEGEAAFDGGAICPHFQKLQEFRRIVLRFVNAFAPNSLGISDKDESFAETDLIDEIVHAAMFNSDVE